VLFKRSVILIDYMCASNTTKNFGSPFLKGRQYQELCARIFQSSAFAQQAELNAKTLHRTLSPKSNPELRNLIAILRGKRKHHMN